MPDPGAALLGAALTAVRGAVERAVRQGARALADAIGVAPAAAAIAAADAHLADARAQADRFAATLAAIPADPAAAAHTASAELGATIAALDRACAALGGPPDALARVAAAAMGAVAPSHGLAGALRLAPEHDAWRVEGTTLVFRLGAREDWSSGPGPVGLTLARPKVTARLEVPTGRVVLALEAVATIRFPASFLADLIPGRDALTAPAPLAITIDSTRGLTVGAGGRRRTGLAAGPGIAPIRVRDLALGVVEANVVRLEVTSVLSGSLGSALEVVLEGSGLLIDIDPSAVQAPSVSARLPDGGRLRLQGGLVRGGGSFSRRGTDYVGTLGLAVGPTSAKAVALIGTAPSFSLTLLVFAELPTPVQLGFGFTLNGVGGLVAVDRGLSTDAFVAHLHDGTIGALLFPADRSRIAPETLQAVFPRQPGAFAIGPAFELGWGARALVTAKLGVFVVLPDARVTVLGTVRVAIPSPLAAIVDLRATVVGELTGERLLIRIALESGSRIAGYPLSGDVGVLVRAGSSPELAIAAGGFHPSYRGPAELAGLRRLAVDLSPPAILTLRAEAYVALTSNALMVGARVELEVRLPGDVADARGHLSFDAIATFDPLHFALDIRAGVSVSVFGETVASVQLALHLEGPHPWVASGTATLELLFLPDIDLSFGPIRWPAGAALPPPPDPVSALELTTAALLEPAATRSFLPPGVGSLVQLRQDAARPGAACHPFGTVEMRQRAVPLETPIATIGSRPTFEREIQIANVAIRGLAPAPAFERTKDLFAPGQFLALHDDERLSRPAFEPYVSGVRVKAPGAPKAGDARDVLIDWETIVPGHDTPVGDIGPVPHGGAGAVLALGAVARARAADPAALYPVDGTPLRAIA